jgi:hypothetical protein
LQARHLDATPFGAKLLSTSAVGCPFCVTQRVSKLWISSSSKQVTAHIGESQLLLRILDQIGSALLTRTDRFCIDMSPIPDLKNVGCKKLVQAVHDMELDPASILLQRRPAIHREKRIHFYRREASFADDAVNPREPRNIAGFRRGHPAD